MGQKRVVSQACLHLAQVEVAIEILKDRFSSLQLSILRKLDSSCQASSKVYLNQGAVLKKYWRHSLGPSTEFGIITNPEIGTIFITGHLAPLFLLDISGTKLGAMSGGPYGILRGLGISPEDAGDHIKALEKGDYLFIARGVEQDLAPLEEV